MPFNADQMIDKVRGTGCGDRSFAAEAAQARCTAHLPSSKISSSTVRHQGSQAHGPLRRHMVLGTLTFGTFLILVITGILLMLYYHPSVPQAYADMKDLQFVVSSGLFLRNLHRWSAQLMVFLVFAHMFRSSIAARTERRASLTGLSASCSL